MANQMLLISKCLLLDEQVPQNIKSSIFSTLNLYARLRYTVEQKLEDLQSLNLNLFGEAEYYACENLNDNILKDLGFNRFDSFPEYLREYATDDCQALNYTRSITRIKTAIEELKKLFVIVVERIPAFSTLTKLSESELEILRKRLFALVEQIEKDYSLVGVLYKPVSHNPSVTNVQTRSKLAA
jgi:hypothetical protein